MPTLKLADADIAFAERGSGPALLFLSGTAWTRDCWELHQVAEFARDHRVIVYDQRGTGASPVRGEDFSIERLALDASALLDHLGIERAILCGHSNGGRVAQMLAATQPARVQQLILLSAGGTHGKPGLPIKMVVGLVEDGYVEYMRAQFRSTGSSAAYYAANRERVEAFVELIVGKLPPLETMLRHVAARQASDVTALAPNIVAPTLVVVGSDETHGDVERTHVEFAAIQAEVIPNAQLVVLPDQGHFYPYYEPELTHRVMREFLVRGKLPA